MTDIYMRNDNLKRTGQLRNVRVESGFVTVCVLKYAQDLLILLTKLTQMKRANTILTQNKSQTFCLLSLSSIQVLNFLEILLPLLVWLKLKYARRLALSTEKVCTH